MTIDEAIEIFEADTSETILNLSELRSDELAEWLEELKELRKWKDDVMNSFCKFDANSVEEVYNKAIYDYMNKLCNDCMKTSNECIDFECPFSVNGKCGIVRSAEQLNEKNENTGDN